ncbi:hypothetical protein [Streptomyces sp. NPDC006463]|uniref:hypothetical protein n=1 Tax=Streptomyces sp. NPDC006463 TaxID=3364746 RepID=UPI00367F7034
MKTGLFVAYITCVRPWGDDVTSSRNTFAKVRACGGCRNSSGSSTARHSVRDPLNGRLR